MATSAFKSPHPGENAGRPVASPLRSRAWTGEDRYRMIAEAAYYRAERRGFAPGHDLQDWLAAEVEVDELLGD